MLQFWEDHRIEIAKIHCAKIVLKLTQKDWNRYNKLKQMEMK